MTINLNIKQDGRPAVSRYNRALLFLTGKRDKTDFELILGQILPNRNKQSMSHILLIPLDVFVASGIPERHRVLNQNPYNNKVVRHIEVP